MKFFAAIALIATVASAAVIKPKGAEIDEIIAAIQSPSTNPATAAALEQMLLDVLGLNPQPVVIGPAIIDAPEQGVAVGPAWVDFPHPDGGAITEPAIVPSPVSIVEGPAVDASSTGAPLVQIVVNVNQAAAESSPVAPSPIIPSPVVIPQPIKPEPVQIVEVAPEQAPPVIPMPVHPIGVVNPSPVQVVETAPVPAEPVLIGTPIIPSPAVVLPEDLN